jgi:hypothetical protein
MTVQVFRVKSSSKNTLLGAVVIVAKDLLSQGNGTICTSHYITLRMEMPDHFVPLQFTNATFTKPAPSSSLCTAIPKSGLL